MSVVLIPIIKDKKAKISSIDNYRPVAIASVVSKVLERIMLDRLSEYLDTMGNQFGFKPKLGTDMCIYSLKEIIGSSLSSSFPFVRGEVLPATFSPPHLIVFSTLLCLLSSSSSLPPRLPSSHLS